MLKLDYKESFNKKAVQKDIFSGIKNKYKHIVGLAGPDINEYLKMLRKFNIMEATIYENNSLQLLMQIARYKRVIPTVVQYKDIFNAPTGLKDTLYDMDFCCSVYYAERYIKKFVKDDTLITLSVRPTTIENTIDRYVQASFNTNKYNVDVEKQTSSFKKYNVKVKNRSIGCYHYRDTSPMLVFTNIKNY